MKNAVNTTANQTGLLTNSQPAGISGLKLDIAEVARHNTSADCWIVIQNKVYSVSNYLTAHLGGASIIAQYCGQDATQAFITKDGQGAHSQSAMRDLASLYIGDLGAITTAQQIQTIDQNVLTNLPSFGREDDDND